MMVPAPHRLACALACLVFLAATPASAQVLGRQDLLDLLDPTVTAPTKRAQSVRDVPATVAVVTEQDIRDRGYLDLVDAIRDLPGVSFIENVTAESGVNEISFRGQLGNDKIAILLNGHRIFFADRPQADATFFFRNFPLMCVKRLEVVYGPGSALYGADAVSAVINVITKDGSEAAGVTVGASYGLGATTSDYLTCGIPLDEDSNFLLAGRFFRGDGEDFDRFAQYADSAKDRQHWPGSSQRDDASSSDFELISYRNKGFSMDFLRTAWNAPAVGAGLDAVFASNDLSRWLASTETLSLDYTTMLGEVQTSTALAYDVFTLDPNSAYLQSNALGAASPAAYQAAYLLGSGRAARLEQTLARTFSQDLGLVGGAVVEDHMGVPETSGLPYPYDPTRAIVSPGFDTSNIQPIEYQNYGLYGQLQLGYVPKLQTTLGARLDYNTRYAPSLTPHIGLVYTPWAATTFKASYGTSYLAPTIGQVYQRFSVPNQIQWVPNPDLRPVRGDSFELSVLQDLGPDCSTSLTFFHNDITDVINKLTTPTAEPGGTIDVFQFVNNSAGTSTGGELRFDDRLGHALSLFASGSLLQGQILDPSDGTYDLPAGSVPLIGHAGLTWRPLAGLTIVPRLTWLSNGITEDGDPVTHGADLPGAWLVDLSARQELGEHLTLTLAGSNLLDWAYDAESVATLFQQGGAIPQNGRRVQAGLTYTF